jgi:D-threonate/D-erythronate kinase
MIVVIADDLTGAAELGAVGLRHGLQSELVTDAQTGVVADLVCVDTDSRSCTPAEAGRRAAAAAEVFQRAGATWIYKKVDSVLRGPVTAELEAVARQLGLDTVLLAPANPSLGRIIKHGRYFICGQPLHESEFAHDPEHPRTTSDVLGLLDIGNELPVCLRRLGEALPPSGIVVAEAETAADLQAWAARQAPGLLPAGGAEFFAALLDLAGCSLARPPAGLAASLNNGSEFFVCGSPSRSASEFVRTAREQGTPVFSLPEAVAGGADWPRAAVDTFAQPVAASLGSHPRVILNIGWPLVGQPARTEVPVTRLAQAAEAVLRQATVGHAYLEGGATAAALFRRLGWSRFRVLNELAPGVATLTTPQAPSLRLTIKPGSYRWPDQVQDVFGGLS